MIRALLLMSALLGRLVLHAQPTVDLRAESDASLVLVRGFQGADATAPALQATWRFSSDTPATFSFQRLSAGGSGELMLRRLVIAGIEQYLDQHVHFGKQGVTADLSDERMMADMNAMVEAAAAEFDASEGVGGFSEATMEQLERVTHIDWSKASFGVDAGKDQDKYLAIYYYVRSQRQELERQLRADLLPLASVAVWTQEPVIDAFSRGRDETVPTVCSTVYDDQNFLCALDLSAMDTLNLASDQGLNDELLASLARQARRTIAQRPPEAEWTPPPPRIRKRDRWLKVELDAINERIDDLDQRKELWALRDRMDDAEARMDDLTLELRELKDRPVDEPSDNPLAVLSELTGQDLVVRFNRGSSELDASHRVILNEVFEQLARSTKDRILITGYTDRSGDPSVNMLLSELRAKAVRNYLLQRGIEADRLLVNYYGDSRSQGHDPTERRVQLEWLK
jgi:outer membrane protein OmpA-like peptidoglycan-associated protein